MYALTKEGLEDLEKGLPETRLLKEVLSGKTLIKELQKLPYFTIGLMWAKKSGWISISNGAIRIEQKGKTKSELEAALSDVKNGKKVAQELIKTLLKRRLVEEVRETTKPMGSEILQLTPEIIKYGLWEKRGFKSYDVSLETQKLYYGKKHILRAVLDKMARVLIEMGFKEMEGTMVDAEFFVHDCLFTPQDHPARTQWDQFSLKQPMAAKTLPEELVRGVRAVHENGGNTGSKGWGYKWDKEIAKRLVLRGHTTSVTAHYLANHKDPPNRFFSIDRVFRNDSVDRTHLLEFYQIEGWVMDNNLTVCDLMGTFGEFYKKIGIKDVRFKPTFNPYTEPSFEIYGRHPKLGEWLEIGNSGIFREEMLKPFGVKTNVMAWGLALERTLMLLYNYDDIRNLHGTLCNIDFLREAPAIWEY